MKVERGVLDTSRVIHLHEVSDASQLPDGSVITSVTLTELALGPLVAADDQDRAAR